MIKIYQIRQDESVSYEQGCGAGAQVILDRRSKEIQMVEPESSVPVQKT